MKLGTVNLRSGGNIDSVSHLGQLMLSHGCSTIVFSEFRDNLAGKALVQQLREAGYTYFAFTQDVRGVLIVSRFGFDATVNPGRLTTFPNAIIRADFAAYFVYAVYLPTGARKVPHFDYLIEAAKMHDERHESGIAIGDFNNGCDKIDIQINAKTGKLVDFFPAHTQFHELDELWPEAWRRLHPGVLEYSWFASNKPISQKQGWRLDHAFLSSDFIAKLKAAEYIAEPRLQGWSDHSALVVEIES